MNEHHLATEQWQPAMNALFDEYTMLFLGVPLLDEEEPKPADVQESDAVSSSAFSNISGQQAGNKKIDDDDRL